jgi:hypothetical protein
MKVKNLGLFSVLAALAAAAGLAVPAAHAGLVGSLLPSCGQLSQPFAQWGDRDGYCAFPNLGFENGSAGWTLNGDASVVSDNEPWQVSGPGSSALRLAPGASALSSPLPISLIDPWVRFFAKNGGANGSLSVQVVFQGPLGNTLGVLNQGSLSTFGYASWSPTHPILSALALPLGTATAEMLVKNTATRGNWLVDDVYLDPCVSKFG